MLPIICIKVTDPEPVIELFLSTGRTDPVLILTPITIVIITGLDRNWIGQESGKFRAGFPGRSVEQILRLLM